MGSRYLIVYSFGKPKRIKAEGECARGWARTTIGFTEQYAIVKPQLSCSKLKKKFELLFSAILHASSEYFFIIQLNNCSSEIRCFLKFVDISVETKFSPRSSAGDVVSLPMSLSLWFWKISNVRNYLFIWNQFLKLFMPRLFYVNTSYF